MLAGRCRGKHELICNGEDGKEVREWRYVYGPCAHLRYVNDHLDDGAKLIGECGIYDSRPGMCSRFPYSLVEDNPALHKGCGYNRDADSGYSMQEILSLLQPLEEGDI